MRIPKFAIKCECGTNAEWVEEYTEPSMFNELCSPEPEFLGWVCEKCGEEYEATEEELEPNRPYNLTPEDNERRMGMYREMWAATRPCKIPDVNLMFEHQPDGDFKWGGEPGDSTPVACGEKDCPIGWHRYHDIMEMGCENGVRYIELGTSDSEGDYDVSARWEETEEAFVDSEVARDLGAGTYDYFRCWAEYWLESATSLEDPLEECWTRKDMTPQEWTEYCLIAARDNVNYMT